MIGLETQFLVFFLSGRLRQVFIYCTWLTLCILETPKWIFYKQWRFLWNATYCGISSGSTLFVCWERSGSVVECLTPDRGAPCLSLTTFIALWSLSKTHNPSLVLVQPRKTRPWLNNFKSYLLIPAIISGMIKFI